MPKILFVSNGAAGSVDVRTKELLVGALSADFDLEVADTAARNHATELSADAVDRSFDAVIVFGGDGTLNEAVQPLVGTGVALGILPGGSTNVMARSLGLASDPLEAAAQLAVALRSGRRRRINVGRLDERYFLFAAGMGLDGEVVKLVEADPEGKRRHREWLFLVNAVKAGLLHYLWTEPRITMTIPGAAPERVMTAVVSNARPFTYFRSSPVDLCPRANLDLGLDLFGLERLGLRMIPRLLVSLFFTRSHPRWKRACYHHDVASATLMADDPMPVQVDGDYIGARTEVELELVPHALALLL